MVKERWLDPMPLLDEAMVLNFLRESNASPEVHARYIWKHIFKTADQNLSNVPNLPEGLAEKLGANFALTTSTIKEKKISVDGTIKMVVLLQDGQLVESVIIRHSDNMP